MSGNFLDYDGLLYYNTGLKSKFLSSVEYDDTNKQFTQTKNGTPSTILTVANLKHELDLDRVGNFKAVSTLANQGLSETEKANARANIGAGDSAFSGNFSDLSNIPTTIAGYGITDAKIANGTITLGSNTITPALKSETVTNVLWDSTNNKITKTINGTSSDVVTAATLKSAMNIVFSDIGSTPTTLSGYGITDASINTSTGTITLGNNTITPLTEHQDISGKADKATTVTSVAWNSSSKKLTETINGTTSDIVSAATLKTAMNIVFNDIGNKPTTLSGYGITDAKIENGVITLGNSTFNLSGVYRYKGSVPTKAKLPGHLSSPPPEAGDVYNVERDGKNYAYVKYEEEVDLDIWDDLGGTFSITAISNEEIDTILAS